eukprot:1265435-Rhodomonas_salina.2
MVVMTLITGGVVRVRGARGSLRAAASNPSATQPPARLERDCIQIRRLNLWPRASFPPCCVNAPQAH